MKQLLAIGLIAIGGATLGLAGTREERLEALEYAVVDPDCDGSGTDEVAGDVYVRQMYEMTADEMVQDLIALSLKYGVDETNAAHRAARQFAVGRLAYYQATNQLEYLTAIWRNPQDYAKKEALLAAMGLCKSGDGLFDIANEVVTNAVAFPATVRSAVYQRLYSYYSRGSETDVPQIQKDRIAAYFLSRVDLEREPIYAFLDGKVCEMFPSYRHSQRRRDNLAAVYDPTLTGAPKEVYEARVRDAQPVEE